MSEFSSPTPCKYREVECVLTPAQLRQIGIGFRDKEKVELELNGRQLVHTMTSARDDPSHNIALHLNAAQVNGFNEAVDQGLTKYAFTLNKVQIASMAKVPSNVVSASAGIVAKKSLDDRKFANAGPLQGPELDESAGDNIEDDEPEDEPAAPQPEPEVVVAPPKKQAVKKPTIKSMRELAESKATKR